MSIIAWSNIFFIIVLVTSCPPAPYPTPDSNLETDYKEGDPVDFGDSVTYTCRSAHPLL